MKKDTRPTIGQGKALSHLAIVVYTLRGAPGVEFRGPDFWKYVTERLEELHSVSAICGRDEPVHEDNPRIPPVKLTPGELKHLEMLAEGLSNYEAAVRTFTSESTVKSMRARLFERIGAVNGPHAVHLGHEYGLLGRREIYTPYNENPLPLGRNHHV